MSAQTQAQAGHTEVPWTTSTRIKAAGHLLPEIHYLSEWECKSHPEAVANSEFIVEACNSHARLLAENAALRKALEEIAQDCEQLSSDGFCDKAEQRTWKSMAVRALAALRRLP